MYMHYDNQLSVYIHENLYYDYVTTEWNEFLIWIFIFYYGY